MRDAGHGPVRSLHATCVARGPAGVLLLGRPGCGKSDLALRLLDRGFALVADDRVLIDTGQAAAPAALAGLIEVRGLGLLRLPFQASVRLRLSVLLDSPVERLPEPERHPTLDLPLLRLLPFSPSTPRIIEIALDCLDGTASLTVGALPPCM
jgi:HPr kinase/phosphorylase